jgi:hypothetical protein
VSRLCLDSPPDDGVGEFVQQWREVAVDAASRVMREYQARFRPEYPMGECLCGIDGHAATLDLHSDVKVKPAVAYTCGLLSL